MVRMASGGDDTYRYPDVNDHITLTLIDQCEIPPGVWEDQESTVLAGVDEVLRQGPLRRLLDYGSGGGRLAVRFADTFESVTSFEPDPDRAQLQREFLATRPQGRRIRVVEDPSDAGADFDVVLCSHVIQHVPHAMADSVLHDVSTRVARGGFAVILTTLSPRSTPVFVLNYVTEDGRAVEDEVSADTFEAALRTRSIGVLPIRFFPFDVLVADLDRLGMDTVTAFGFHGNSGVVGPTTVTSPELLRCRDMVLVTRRR